MRDTQTRLAEVCREIDKTEAAISPLFSRLKTLRAQRAKLESQSFIEINMIKKGDVEPMNGEGRRWFGTVDEFAKWLAANSKKSWAEWNGRIYHTFDLINDRMPDMPGFVEDLKD